MLTMEEHFVHPDTAKKHAHKHHDNEYRDCYRAAQLGQSQNHIARTAKPYTLALHLSSQGFLFIIW